jgi:hypothetical protein
MTPLPEDANDRYIVEYLGLNGQYSMQFRASAAGAPNPDVVTGIRSFLTALLPVVFDDVTFTGVNYISAGTGFANPVSGWTALVGTATGNQLLRDSPAFITFVGRGTTGRRVRHFVYETNVLPDANYRVNLGDNATIDAALVILNGPGWPCRDIASTKPLFKLYVNTGFNAYKQRKLRTV